MSRRLSPQLLSPHKLIVCLSVPVNGPAVIPHAVAVEVRPAEIGGARSLHLALAVPVVLVPGERVEGAGPADNSQGRIVPQQSIDAKRARADGDIAPRILGLLAMMNLIVQPALRARRGRHHHAGSDHSRGQKAGGNHLASHSELLCLLARTPK